MNCTWVNLAEEITSDDFKTPSTSSQDSNSDIEIIALCEDASKEFEFSAENMLVVSNEKILLDEILKKDIPKSVFWSSILSAFQSATTYQQMEDLAKEVSAYLPPLEPRIEVRYNPGMDNIDLIAQAEIPMDGPSMLRAILMTGDGNCLGRSLSKSFFNTEERHVEIRVHIIVEGELNMKSYLSGNCLERGASHLHANAGLPTVFATFSDFYTPGQRLTQDTIDAFLRKIRCIHGSLADHSSSKCLQSSFTYNISTQGT